MSRSSGRLARTALLAAALLLPSFLGFGHHHDLSLGSEHRADLPSHWDGPVYSGGHDHPDPTTHLEAATRVDSAECLACSMRQRERDVTLLEWRFGQHAPDLGETSAPLRARPTVGALRPFGARGPPLS